MCEKESGEYLPKEKEDVIKTKKAVYEIRDRLSKSATSTVFHVIRLNDKKEFAMKCESWKSKSPSLRHQARVYESLKSVISPHFLTYEDRGLVEDRFIFIVVKLVGKNLIDVLADCPDKKFSMCGYIHRDIKPDNFAIGREEDGNLHTVFILDFKFARKFMAEGKDLRLQRQQAPFRGVPRYASIAALSMTSQLEEMIHMKKMVRQKQNLKKFLKNTPEEYMANIILYIDALQYNSIPDYDHIATQLETAAKAYYLNFAAPPDWDLMAEYKGPKYEKNVAEGMGKA
ncbi:unnamed protein product [Angiostrongylus costaricensis]|uniref:Protein kinase domain-containing protein n=1 Tax=Angiostrongylus costaricensis TaxID=334426 RepID=A0A158PFR5_ANGCS|nr:unnamed protein product [Angiostrongylus costaricensis]